MDQNGERKRSLSHFLDLEGNLKKHYSVQFSSLERMGEFYTWLKETEEDLATAVLRACVQDFVRENYPLQTGAKVLGTEISLRQLEPR